MTVEETIKLTSEDIKSLKKGSDGYYTLPTILDVLEYLSRRDNEEAIKYLLDFPNLEGNYLPTAAKPRSSIIKFMPCSQSTFTYMRGQNVYKSPCLPLLFRKESGRSEYDSEIIAKIRTSEFIRIIMSHPVMQALGPTSDYVAIAQHYGMRTNLLDITNNKWVAAFFACTKNDDDIYSPIGEEFEDGIGVLYTTNRHNVADEFITLGYQFFERPSKQFSFVYPVAKGADFDKNPLFDRIVFRHDINASSIVYHMAYDQVRFYPNDELATISKAIRQEGYSLSWESVKYCRTIFNISVSDEEIKDVLKRNNILFHMGVETGISFTKEQLENAWNWWVQFKSLDLGRHTLDVPLISYLPNNR